MYFVYVLQSRKDGKRYYGQTKDLENRLKEHNDGQVVSTRSRKPFDIVYFEKVNNVSEARKKEKYFKSGFGRKYISGKINIKALSSIG